MADTSALLTDNDGNGSSPTNTWTGEPYDPCKSNDVEHHALTQSMFDIDHLNRRRRMNAGDDDSILLTSPCFEQEEETVGPTVGPTAPPTTLRPTPPPTPLPTLPPSSPPTTSPTPLPTTAMPTTAMPTTAMPTTAAPTAKPSEGPTRGPTQGPTRGPTPEPSSTPTSPPSSSPTSPPSESPTSPPSASPTFPPSSQPTSPPSSSPTKRPTPPPTTARPSSASPTIEPTMQPNSEFPTGSPITIEGGASVVAGITTTTTTTTSTTTATTTTTTTTAEKTDTTIAATIEDTTTNSSAETNEQKEEEEQASFYSCSSNSSNDSNFSSGSRPANIPPNSKGITLTYDYELHTSSEFDAEILSSFESSVLRDLAGRVGLLDCENDEPTRRGRRGQRRYLRGSSSSSSILRRTMLEEGMVLALDSRPIDDSMADTYECNVPVDNLDASTSCTPIRGEMTAYLPNSPFVNSEDVEVQLLAMIEDGMTSDSYTNEDVVKATYVGVREDEDGNSFVGIGDSGNAGGGGSNNGNGSASDPDGIASSESGSGGNSEQGDSNSNNIWSGDSNAAGSDSGSSGNGIESDPEQGDSNGNGIWSGESNADGSVSSGSSGSESGTNSSANEGIDIATEGNADTDNSSDDSSSVNGSSNASNPESTDSSGNNSDNAEQVDGSGNINESGGFNPENSGSTGSSDSGNENSPGEGSDGVSGSLNPSNPGDINNIIDSNPATDNPNGNPNGAPNLDVAKGSESKELESSYSPPLLAIGISVFCIAFALVVLLSMYIRKKRRRQQLFTSGPVDDLGYNNNASLAAQSTLTDQPPSHEPDDIELLPSPDKLDMRSVHSDDASTDVDTVNYTYESYSTKSNKMEEDEAAAKYASLYDEHYNEGGKGMRHVTSPKKEGYGHLADSGGGGFGQSDTPKAGSSQRSGGGIGTSLAAMGMTSTSSTKEGFSNATDSGGNSDTPKVGNSQTKMDAGSPLAAMGMESTSSFEEGYGDAVVGGGNSDTPKADGNSQKNRMSVGSSLAAMGMASTLAVQSYTPAAVTSPGDPTHSPISPATSDDYSLPTSSPVPQQAAFATHTMEARALPESSQTTQVHPPDTPGANTLVSRTNSYIGTVDEDDSSVDSMSVSLGTADVPVDTTAVEEGADGDGDSLKLDEHWA